MNVQKKLFLSIFLSCASQSLCVIPLADQLKQKGYVEICDTYHGSVAYDALYACFDELIQFLHTNPSWAQKLFTARERFIRSKDRDYYSTNFFGFYDESAVATRGQVAFYYSVHFHEFIISRYPEFNNVPQIVRFFNACLEIQKVYGDVVNHAAAELDIKTIFSSTLGHPPILFKVIKYLSSYKATRPHYDGTALSLFLDSTDNQSLLLSPYKSAYSVDDFYSPIRSFSRCGNQNSILLIPGTLLAEYSIYPTPHIVAHSGKVRYATIAFAMRPGHIPTKNEFTQLPHFNIVE